MSKGKSKLLAFSQGTREEVARWPRPLQRELAEALVAARGTLWQTFIRLRRLHQVDEQMGRELAAKSEVPQELAARCISAAALVMRITEEEIRDTAKRPRLVADARKMISAYLHRGHKYSARGVARALYGSEDHKIIMHNCSAHNDLMQWDAAYQVLWQQFIRCVPPIPKPGHEQPEGIY